MNYFLLLRPVKHFLKDRALNREILRLSIPSILANITVPLVGLVDTAVAGHLTASGVWTQASYIGGIALGAMLFNLLFWNFSFLRTGTGGLTAQAFGRGDMRDAGKILARGLCLALSIAAVTLALQKPYMRLGIGITGAEGSVVELASGYFLLRIWAAPATLSLMVFRGWFVGMQDSVSSMWTDLVVNTVNVCASLLLSFGCFGWPGLGYYGIAAGTVCAQYSGLLFAVLVMVFKYRTKVLGHLGGGALSGLFGHGSLLPFLKMNGHLAGRALCFTCIYMGYTATAATFGETLLACASIMMQLLMLFSYFTDGFAYAGEALSGRFIGEGNAPMLRRTVRYIFVWSMGIAVLFVGLYQLCGEPLVRIFTSDEGVVHSCTLFLPWLLVMPPLGCAAFTWDGIYLGATASRGLFLSMLGALAAFLLGWYGLRPANPPEAGALSLHILLGAYFLHLAFRTVYLSAAARKEVYSRLEAKASK